MNNNFSAYNVKPSLNLLTGEQIQFVHNNSLKILSETGIKVESESARLIFQKSGGVIIKDEIVFIQPDLIKEFLNLAPSKIDVFTQKGEHAFALGKGQTTRFGSGVTNMYFQNINDEKVIPFTRSHTREAAQLNNLLVNFDMISTPGIPSDADPLKTDILNFLDIYANSLKPIVLLVTENNKLNDILELLSHLHGDFAQRPFVIPYFNPVTPLVLNKSTTDKMEITINHGLPFIFSNYSMYGGSTPVTEAGTLALLNAELLAGLVYSQLIKKGTPIVLGSLPAAFEMNTMGSYYTSASYLLNVACAEMIDFYELPHCGSSGSGNGWGPDLIASGNLWLNHLTSIIGKVGCAPFVGGNFDSMVFSPETIVLSDHIIGESRKFAQGFSLDMKNIGLNSINESGPGGNFFTSDQTLLRINEFTNQKEIWPPMSLELWQKQGSPDAKSKIKEYTLEIYNKAISETEKNNDLIIKGEKFIQKNF